MSTRSKSVLGVVLVIAIVYMAIQIIPVPGRTNPVVKVQIKWDSPTTATLVRAACFDCHSNETNWPWYSYLAPFSWTTISEVQAGRAALNFSEQNARQIDPRVLIDSIESGRMPPASYTATHPDARLTEQRKQALIAGLQASLAGGAPASSPQGESGAQSDAGQAGEAGEGVGGG